MWASYTSAARARVGGNWREVEPAANREGRVAAPRGFARVPSAVERNDRVRAAGRPARGVS